MDVSYVFKEKRLKLKALTYLSKSMEWNLNLSKIFFHFSEDNCSKDMFLICNIYFNYLKKFS